MDPMWVDCHISDAMDSEDDSLGSIAFTFVILFLITLFYSVGATVIKVTAPADVRGSLLWAETYDPRNVGNTLFYSALVIIWY